MAASVAFDTSVSSVGNNTGIVVPDELLAQLGAGKRPSVVVNVNGFEYQNAVGSMGGKAMISISSAVRKETGLKGGDAIHVVLTVADAPREVEMPAELAAALKAEPELKKFFDGLSNSLQRFHADNVSSAKAADTKQKRIDKTLQLFREGKKR